MGSCDNLSESRKNYNFYLLIIVSDVDQDILKGYFWRSAPPESTYQTLYFYRTASEKFGAHKHEGSRLIIFVPNFRLLYAICIRLRIARPHWFAILTREFCKREKFSGANSIGGVVRLFAHEYGYSLPKKYIKITDHLILCYKPPRAKMALVT